MLYDGVKVKRLKRSESFLGIHFDFHAGEDNNEIGANTTKEMIDNIIDLVKPDYIQCDCKGHPGFSSYPTKVGNPAPGIKKDALRVWREATAENGVSLFMHYSGVWDNQAIRHHPSWARIDENGQPDGNFTSTFGPYADELLIPQLRELCDSYGMDGVWIDGDCWATCHDYGRNALERFKAETGILMVPKKPSDPYFFEFTEFCREAFRRYVRHNVDEIHKHSPNFQIASNWAFTSFMPEPVNINVDYISGDYSLQNSVNTARFDSRCMTGQGKPWDLMAWAFSNKWGEKFDSLKSVPQLEQEAAAVLSVGGGFQAYFTQKRDGSVKGWQMRLMKEVAQFCRARQKTCHKAAAVPQVALLYSGTDFYRNNTKLFGPMDEQLDPIKGTLQALLDSQYSVEIKMEHQLQGHMNDFPVIINPGWSSFKPGFREELLEYVKNGGNLLVIGTQAVVNFENELGVKIKEDVNETDGCWLGHGGWLCGVTSAFRRAELKSGTKAFGRMFMENDNIGSYDPAATIASYGNGKIAGAYFNFGERYLNACTPTLRDFIGKLTGELFPKPAVKVTGSHHVDVAVNRIDGKLAVNLVNTSGPHADKTVYVYDEIPPVGPLDITIRYQQEPKKITIMPEGRQTEYLYTDGEINFTLERLLIHDIIIIE
jgi:alpha-L-fucosidase